jgi:hypothetical protein
MEYLPYLAYLPYIESAVMIINTFCSWEQNVWDRFSTILKRNNSKLEIEDISNKLKKDLKLFFDFDYDTGSDKERVEYLNILLEKNKDSFYENSINTLSKYKEFLIENSIINGKKNDITLSKNSMINGNNNKISDTTNSIVLGDNNNFGRINNSIILGSGNKIGK